MIEILVLFVVFLLICDQCRKYFYPTNKEKNKLLKDQLEELKTQMENIELQEKINELLDTKIKIKI